MCEFFLNCSRILTNEAVEIIRQFVQPWSCANFFPGFHCDHSQIFTQDLVFGLSYLPTVFSLLIHCWILNPQFLCLIWWICSQRLLGCAADGVWTNIHSMIESTITINRIRIRLFSEKLLDFFFKRKKINLHIVDVLIHSDLFWGTQDTPIA